MPLRFLQALHRVRARRRCDQVDSARPSRSVSLHSLDALYKLPSSPSLDPEAALEIAPELISMARAVLSAVADEHPVRQASST